MRGLGALVPDEGGPLILWAAFALRAFHASFVTTELWVRLKDVGGTCDVWEGAEVSHKPRSAAAPFKVGGEW